MLAVAVVDPEAVAEDAAAADAADDAAALEALALAAATGQTVPTDVSGEHDRLETASSAATGR
ncbi:hypothetical protein CMsap09_00415 [Clavibacter michiganensis]|uniref:Uncharacterized protein n=1 Tax=Clavibacter michiganensis TaxID=28447 RepID=A0A251XPD1_9MICO|nr:hypothetical protein CMsap09_00415 [Clavibacter michiganensis]